jgi:hypothetical protein
MKIVEHDQEEVEDIDEDNVLSLNSEEDTAEKPDFRKAVGR